MAQQARADIRPSPIAGQWYPGNPQRLAETVDRMLEAAPAASVPGEIVGLVVPHAGYVYSGPIAARAFKLVMGRAVERVVLVSPMHHVYADPVLSTAHEAYSTPLGVIEVDAAALSALAERVPIARVRRDPEHSLEIELPFLQRALNGPFSLVPLMLRDQSLAGARRLGQAIARVLGSAERTLLVASSDLSHFYPDAAARKLDQVMLERIAAFDAEGVIQAEEQGQAFACGRGAIATVLIAARELGADAVQIVGYGTSADASGDTSRVVGYGAAAVYRAQV